MGKTNSIKELDYIRREIIGSSFKDIPKITDLLKKASSISKIAPLRDMIKYDGTPFTNFEERQLLLTIFEREINELQCINEKDFPYYRLQITVTIVMLMVSISDYGIIELENIINNPTVY